MFQNLPFPAAQKVRDRSSGVTLCIVTKNDVVVFSLTLDKGGATGTYSNRQRLLSALEVQRGAVLPHQSETAQ